MASIPQASQATTVDGKELVALEVENFKKEYNRYWHTVRLRVKKLSAIVCTYRAWRCWELPLF